MTPVASALPAVLFLSCVAAVVLVHAAIEVYSRAGNEEDRGE